MNEVTPIRKTNADLVQPYVNRAKVAVVGLGQWAKEHPDEAALGIAPVILVAFATRRHHLSMTETFIMAEVSYWLGLLAVNKYREWKKSPTTPLPKGM